MVSSVLNFKNRCVKRLVFFFFLIKNKVGLFPCGGLGACRRAALSLVLHTQFRNLPVLFSAPVDSVLLFITFHSFGLCYFLFVANALRWSRVPGAGQTPSSASCLAPAPLPRTPLHSVMREDPEMPSICFPSSDLSKEPSDSYDDEIVFYVLPLCTYWTKDCSLSSSFGWDLRTAL